MSEVALRIGGRTFRVACAPGEEERIVKLGTVIADKLAALGNPGGPDAQNLLFAALLLADEVHELRENAPASAAEPASPPAGDQAEMESELARLRSAQQAAADEIAAHEAKAAALETELAALRAAPAAPPPAAASAVDELAPALEKFAEMLEQCADKLERRPSAA